MGAGDLLGKKNLLPKTGMQSDEKPFMLRKSGNIISRVGGGTKNGEKPLWARRG